MKTLRLIALTWVVITGMSKEGIVGQIGLHNVALPELAQTAPIIILAVLRPEGNGMDVMGAYTPDGRPLLEAKQIPVPTYPLIGPAAEGSRPVSFTLDIQKFYPSEYESMTPGHPYIIFLNPGGNKHEYYLAAMNGFVSPNRFQEFRESTPQLVWTGRALKKPKAAVFHFDSVDIPVEGLTAWPENVAGQAIQGTGLLSRTKDGSGFVFQEFRWQLLSPSAPANSGS